MDPVRGLLGFVSKGGVPVDDSQHHHCGERVDAFICSMMPASLMPKFSIHREWCWPSRAERVKVSPCSTKSSLFGYSARSFVARP
jgi:hypothetical protein